MRILNCAALFAAFFSINANAAILSTDWQTAGDNLVTRDTTTGLEWLDLSVTSGRTYDDIAANLGAGQEFDGWRYATGAEISDLWTSFGGNPAYYNGFSTENDGLFQLIAPYLGDLYCNGNIACDTGNGYSFMLTSDEYAGGGHYAALMLNAYYHPDAATQDNFSLHESIVTTYAPAEMGSALVRSITVVPVPAAIWLFVSGLVGLGFMTRRKAA